MKFIVTMKDPDGVHESIINAAISAADTYGGTAYAKAAIAENESDWLREFLAEWFEHSEYAFIEVDTDAKSARLLTLKEYDAILEAQKAARAGGAK